MIIARKLFSNRKKNESDEKKKDKKKGGSSALEVIGGGAAGLVGLNQLDKAYRAGEVTGKVHMYHGTTKEAAESIKKEGLKGSYALDPNSITNTEMGNLGQRDGRKLIYLGKKRRPSIFMAINQKVMRGKTPAMINVAIPYEDLKKMKRVYDNPEFRAYKDKKDYVTRNEGQVRGLGGNKHFLADYYDTFSGDKGTSGTAIFEGDIDSKYIKGSKNYQKNTIKDVANYIKKNPGRFLKGVGRTALGGSLIAGGVVLNSDKLKKKIKDKFQKNKENKKKK